VDRPGSKRSSSTGVSPGVHIENEIDPKHSVFDGPLLPIADLTARVATAVDARRSDDFVIIVRSNEFQVDNGGGTGSLEEMIGRAVAAAEAGADAFIPTFADERQLAAIAAEVALPLGGYQALIPGLQFTLFTGCGVSAAAHAHRRIATHIFEHGSLPPDYGGDFDRRTLTGQTAYDEVIRRWAEQTGRSTRPLPW
jgi:2-methylisocitrate lyase-like PEP mutase family enzyme